VIPVLLIIFARNVPDDLSAPTLILKHLTHLFVNWVKNVLNESFCKYNMNQFKGEF